MRASGGFIACVIISLAVGLYLIWFWHNFDKVPIERIVGASREARANRLLGAEHLLESFGKQVQGFRRLTGTPPADATLFLPASRRKLPDELMADLKIWAFRGGYLLVVAPAEGELDKDRILEEWGVTGREYFDGDGLATVQIESWETTLSVAFSYAFELDDDIEPVGLLVESNNGVHSVTSAVGAGHITVLSDYRFATNDSIGEHDNAAFLWHLLSLNQSPQVWLVHGGDAPSLWEHLRNRAWMVLVSVAGLIAIMIWASCRRFGPLIPDPSLKRRRLLEHIEASGRFLWRYRQSEELLHAVQASLLRSLEFRHPGWSATDDMHRKLAEASGFTPKDIMLALTQREVRDEHAFAQMVKTLELIRNRL